MLKTSHGKKNQIRNYVIYFVGFVLDVFLSFIYQLKLNLGRQMVEVKFFWSLIWKRGSLTVV